MILRIAACCVVVAALCGCDSDYVKTSKSGSAGSTTVSVAVDRDEIRRDKEAFRKRAQERIAEWERKLDEMTERAARATGEAKADFEREIEAQKPKLEEARRELKEIDAVAEEKWNEFKARSSKAWDDISDGFERAFSRFK